MKKYEWLDAFNKEISTYNHFGGNCFGDQDHALQYLKKIDKLWGKIKIVDYERILIKLPEDPENAKKLLLYIIETPPTPTYTHYIKRSDSLELSWS